MGRQVRAHLATTTTDIEQSAAWLEEFHSAFAAGSVVLLDLGRIGRSAPLQLGKLIAPMAPADLHQDGL